MSRAGHEHVGAIFSGARRLPPSERTAYLDEECADDANLRREVESLLGEHDEESGFLDTQHLREKLG